MTFAFLRRALLLVLIVLPTVGIAAPPNDQPANDQPVRQAWQLLDYIAVDYAGAVRDGKVLDAGEFAEMREFSATAKERIATLPANPKQGELTAAANALAVQIEQHAAPTAVADAAHALADGLLKAYGIAATPKQPPNLQHGAQLYAAQCASCHGPTGQGDGPAAAGLNPPPVAFADATRAAQRSPLALFETISQGLAGTSMPAFSQLSSDDRWALAYYAGSLAYSDADRVQGETLWRENTSLHAALPTLEALSRSSQSELAKRLDATQARTITAYLRTHPEAITASTQAKPASLDVARTQLAASLQAYQAGEQGKAKSLALSAYLDGVEPVEPMLAARDATLLRDLESAMAQVRSGISAGAPVAQINASAAKATELFDRAETLLNGSQTNTTAAFVGSFTILVREGLEALLIVIAMIAFLRRSERRDALHWVHLGWIAALIAGGITWAAATWLIDISGAQRELTEGLSSLFAALVLLSVGIWMHQKSLAGRWQHYLQTQLSAAMGRRSMIFLFSLSFIAVYREVFETILFYAAMWNPTDANAILAGLVAGVAVLVLVAFALLKLGMRLPIGKFFAASSLLIAVLAVVLVGKGIMALQEAGWIGLGLVTAPRIDWLGVYPSWQSLLGQVLVLLVAVAGFVFNSRGAQTKPQSH